MSCGPCKPVEPLEIAEGDEEYEALTDLYKRLFENLDDDFCPVPATGHSGDANEDCGCTPPPVGALPSATGTIVPDYCQDTNDQMSVLKQADRQLMALLKRRKEHGGGAIAASAAEGDVKHLTARLPVFKNCRTRKPGTLNSTLFGLDLEHWMSASNSGSGHDLAVKRAAYDLAAAEAHCKYPGAVEAAEIAVQVEPAGYLAEVAARFGAETYTGTGLDADGTGRDEDDESPIVVVAYVGSTKPDDDDDEPKKKPC